MSQLHTDWKFKKNNIAKREHNAHLHMEDLVRNKSNDKVRENFFRPAYGHIGERREEKYEDSV